MIRQTLALLMAVALFPVAAQAENADESTVAATRPDSFADLSEKLLPAVVNISTMTTLEPGRNVPEMEMPQFPPGSPFEDFFRDFMDRQGGGFKQPRKASSLGSGFVIDAKEGFIITNNHVIADADEVTVILQDDTNLNAKVIGKDEKTDLALLKVDPSGHQLVGVTWGDSDAMRVGDWILAIGNPFGLGGTVTQGIISARARNINSGPYDDFLQTDASINRGNSGGPMFNLKGEVVGINSAIFSPSGGSIGIGFAIPANLAKTVIAQLKEYGRTKRGWLGVRIQGVTPEIADSLNFGTARGALISSVTPEGPAAKAGLEAGDIVTMFNGRPIEEMRRLPRIVAETEVGAEVPISVWRKGETLEKRVQVGELEEAEDKGLVEATVGRGTAPDMPKESEKVLGLDLSTLNKQLRMQFEVDDKTEGVLIVGVDGNSKAAESDIAEGDVIVEANQKPVKTPAEFKAQLDAAKKGGRKSIFLLIERKGDLRFVALPVMEEKKKEEGKKP